MPKSLFEFIAEAIDEALSQTGREISQTGREIYLLGFERYERAYYERRLKEERRALDKSYPLFADREK